MNIDGSKASIPKGKQTKLKRKKKKKEREEKENGVATQVEKQKAILLQQTENTEFTAEKNERKRINEMRRFICTAGVL